MNSLRRTKIVTTLGPATDSREKIGMLLDLGVNVFRLNASHGTLEEHVERINIIKELRKEKNKNAAILFDLQGPKIRVGKLENGGPIPLVEGKEITITSEPIVGNSECISTNYPDIAADVNVGDKILLNDGIFALQVKEIIGKSVKTVILAGGDLAEHKGVNIPGTTNSLSSVGEKDQRDIIFAVEHKVDYIGMSFVRTAEDLRQVKHYIKQAGGNIPVVAKIEKPQALDNLDEIIEVTDGVMVARGDLGIELAPHKVPLAQKRVISHSKIHNKFVITATQMLESMVNNPIPTRAEASDVANAILDGTDAIMLSEETSVGKYPDKAVMVMEAIAGEIECNSTAVIRKVEPKVSEKINLDSHAIARSVIDLCDELMPAAVIAFTRSGYTASLLSSFKPCVPVLAVTHDEKVFYQLAVYWGVTPFQYDMVDVFHEDSLEDLCNYLKEKTPLKSGDKVIIIGGAPYLVSSYTNFIRVYTIK